MLKRSTLLGSSGDSLSKTASILRCTSVMFSPYTRPYRCFQQQTVRDPERRKYFGFSCLSAPVQTKGPSELCTQIRRSSQQLERGRRHGWSQRDRSRPLHAVTLNSQKCQRETNSRSHGGVDQLHAEAHMYTRQLVSTTSEINPETPHPSCYHFGLYVSGQCRGFGIASDSSLLPFMQFRQLCGRVQRSF